VFTLKEGHICPACEKGTLCAERKTLSFDFNGRSKKFENLKVYSCDVCEYEGLSVAAAAEVGEMVPK